MLFLSVYVEKDFPVDVKDQLLKMGYNIKLRDQIGRTELILTKKRTITAVGDKRGDDDARGY